MMTPSPSPHVSIASSTAAQRLCPDDAAARYIKAGLGAVNGWLHPVDAAAIAAIGNLQTAAGIVGGVGEIGVHHGKLAILLYLMMHRGERGFCIDVFDMQHLNVDGSGRGNLEIFTTNLKKFKIPEDRVAIIRAASEAVSPDDLRGAAGSIRLFSVDGGHTAEATLTDLRLAAATTCEQAVVILDDVFNKDWPGVAEGLSRFLADGSCGLRPFAISVNKVFLCRADCAGFYQTGLREALAAEFCKTAEFFGAAVAIFGKRNLLADAPARRPLMDRILRSPAGRATRWYLHRAGLLRVH